MDFIESLPETQNGNTGIFTIVDKFSKMCDFIVIPAVFDAVAVAKAYIEHVVRLHGIP